MKKWKQIAVSVLAFTIMAAIPGCTKEEIPLSPVKTELVIWHYWDVKENKKQLDNLVEAFNDSQDEIEAELQFVPSEDFKKQLALSMADDKMPDLALVDSSDFQYFYAMQPFVDLTDQVPELEHYIPAVMEPCKVGDRIYGQPFGVNCPALFYNKKIFREAGVDVPKNWDDFYQAAVGTTGNNKYGVALSALQSEQSLYEFLPILWGMGADVDSLDSPAGKNAFDLLTRLTSCRAMSRDCINLTMNDLMNQFADENIAMVFQSSSIIDDLRERNPELEFDIARLPYAGDPVTVAGGEVFAVTRGEQQDAAVAFLNYIADKDRMTAYMDDFGLLAPRQDVMDTQYKDDPMKHKFIELFKTARYREVSPAWPQISSVVARAMRQSIIGEKRNEEILQEAADEVRRIREGEG
ncbi:ABC transporter substrate-binding protein [uncultured Robinsoniella sp.]|uniref:ABC transporter substrate-binding protein n=1 Tax=uncultured Robinsoniella sp. TaxID=904190 RepID=UPI00374FD5B1